MQRARSHARIFKKWIKVVKIFSLEWIWIFFSFFLKNNNYISDNGKIWEQVNKSLKANFWTKVFWTTIQNKLCVKKSSRGGLVDRAVTSHSVRMRSFLSAVDRIPLGPDILLLELEEKCIDGYRRVLWLYLSRCHR